VCQQPAQGCYMAVDCCTGQVSKMQLRGYQFGTLTLQHQATSLAMCNANKQCIKAVEYTQLGMKHKVYTGWWRGVVGNVFRLKQSYSTPGPVSTAMGDCLRAGKPSRCEACQLSRLSLLPSLGR